MANKITVTSAGTVVNASVTPDTAMYYSNKSKDWAISDRIVDNTDYSSKYYANESKKQADISTAKTTEVVESGNTAISNIENARDNAITNVNTAGATQVALATEQATIATNKASEVVASGNEALTNIDTAKNNAITSITNQETTSKTSLIDEGATQVGLIQNEGATQVANVQSTGFYMRDDKLYFINSQGEETEFKLDDIELNNPYSLFDSKYSDHELNNLSWLKSEGQWNPKSVYPTAYDKLLKVYNGTETVEGLSVKLSTETYTDYDFVLNTSDETFRLPLLDGSEDLLSDRYIDLELLASGSTYTAPANGWYALSKLSTGAEYINLANNTAHFYIEQRVAGSGQTLAGYLPVKKGDNVYIKYSAGGKTSFFRFIYTQGNGSLYYYVGETVQNANLIDAGRIGEQVANCITRNDCKAYITETYVNGTSGYNIYSNKYCEQWGTITSTSHVDGTYRYTVTLLKPYKDASYQVYATPIVVRDGDNTIGVLSTGRTTTKITFGSVTEYTGMLWKAEGYIA